MFYYANKTTLRNKRRGGMHLRVYATSSLIILNITSVFQFPPTRSADLAIECWLGKYFEQVLLRNRDSCPMNEVRCSSGECIDGSFLCDGKADCRDKSDEATSLNNKTCSKVFIITWLRCIYFFFCRT